jgi:hypothetical protein
MVAVNPVVRHSLLRRLGLRFDRRAADAGKSRLFRHDEPPEKVDSKKKMQVVPSNLKNVAKSASRRLRVGSSNIVQLMHSSARKKEVKQPFSAENEEKKEFFSRILASVIKLRLCLGSKINRTWMWRPASDSPNCNERRNSESENSKSCGHKTSFCRGATTEKQPASASLLCAECMLVRAFHGCG